MGNLKNKIMSEEKEIKSIKLSLPFVTEDGKSRILEQVVTFKKVIEKDKSSYFNGNFPTYSMGMSIAIPTHIHQKLVGTTVPRKRGLSDDRGKTYDVKFPKTLTCNSLESLTDCFREIMYDYKWLIDLEKMELKKVIFYNFDGDILEKTKSHWDSKTLGSKSDISYGYMIGYIGVNGKSEVRLNLDKKIMQNRDGVENEWLYVTHTETRESFFKTIFNKFQSLYNDLKSFSNSLNETAIDNIIKSQPKFIAN